MTDPDDYYLTIFTATLRIASRTGFTNNFEFGIDGDDAVEVIIRGVPGGDFILGWYGAHGDSNWNWSAHSDIINSLPNGEYPIEFRHHEKGGGETWGLRYRRQKTDLSWSNWELVDYSGDSSSNTYYADNMLKEQYWTQDFYNLIISPALASTITDYEVRVVVCDAAFPEDNCKEYPDGNYKPIGLLQKYGESDQMMFGLLTGSYENNTQGGVLRKNVGSITDEIDANNGTILVPTSGGIIDTINKLHIADFTYSGYQYQNCGWITTRPVNDSGECVAWGNPTGEMMYETLRYFAGKKTPTSVFDYSGTTIDNTLGLPKPAWIDPYLIEDTNRNGVEDAGEDANGNGDFENNFENCSLPFMLVLSDIYPTYDSNDLPGSAFSSFTGDLTSPTMDVESLADTITAGEGTFPDDHFIGEQGSTYDGACTPKSVDDLGESRGLCPEEPTKQGSYYAASVAYYGNKHDISQTATGNQNVTTYAVGLASPLPQINIEVNGQTVTVVPFAKSTGGYSINTAEGSFQPTNTIVDFFVETITATHGTFRVNFEDVEQGADHDMDAIVRYEYTVNANGTVDITLDSTYAAGGIEQHMGYIISGTTADGTYLEVRDKDTTAANDNDYFLDTPPACTAPDTPNDCWDDNVELPLITTRTFTPSTSPAATLLDNPLKYAAKWGGFIDSNTATEDVNDNGVLDTGEDLNGNGAIDYTADPTPDLTTEWDEDNDGNPDSYFYVVNPLRLEEQLGKSFAAMLTRASSGTAASVISNSRSGEGAVYQSIFYPELKLAGSDTLTWAGQVHSLFVDAYGNMREDTNGNLQLNIHDEDLDGDGLVSSSISEDFDGDGVLDVGEDLNGNNRLDMSINEDVDGDGVYDTRDLIVVFDGTKVFKYDDVNENQVIDIEDQVEFEPDYPNWHNNGVLNHEAFTDSNGNGVYDAGEAYTDANGNGIFDTEDLNGNGTGPDTEFFSGPHTIDEINFIWNTTDTLNQQTMTPLVQRTYSSNNINQRHILTFIDADQDMIVDSGELQPFLSGTPTTADLTDTSKIYPYLTLYPTHADKPTWAVDIDSHGNGDEFRKKQSQRVIDYIRGLDQAAVTVGTSPYIDAIPAMRNRVYVDGSVNKTWRLGDIVHSSPVVVSSPSESYHLLYRDPTYANFVARHQQRRSVVYVGGNDGMIHAFNAGFYDSDDKSFYTSLGEPFTDVNGDDNYDDGTETYTDADGDGHFDGDIGEPYVDADLDGHYDMAEPFVDSNGDGQYDDGTETYTDTDGDGVYDAGDSYTDDDGDCRYDAAEPIINDIDSDGNLDDVPEVYSDDNSNGSWDVGEAFTDLDGDGAYDDGSETYSDVDGDGHWDSGETYNDDDGNLAYTAGEPFVDNDGDCKYDAGESFTDNDQDGTYDAVRAILITTMTAGIPGRSITAMQTETGHL